MRREPTACLAIGGFDPSGGAGVLADAEAIVLAGARPVAAVTAVTAQNHLLFQRAWPVPPDCLEAQLESLLYAYPVAAVKTGAFPTAHHVRVVAAMIRGRGVPLVVDPVLGASRGPGLVAPSVRRALLDHLVPLATLVTPNVPEAAALSGRPVRDRAGAEAAAAMLIRAGAGAVLLKGGHLEGLGDLFATRTRRMWLAVRTVRGVATHGTGCALASSIAGRLAAGRTLPSAVRIARAVVAVGLADSASRRAPWGPDLVGLRLAHPGGRARRGPVGVY